MHAIGQVVAVTAPDDRIPDAAVGKLLNTLLPEDISVSDVITVGAAFDPRRDARWREYRYRISTGDRNPLTRNLVLRWRQPLDLSRMDAAAGRFAGEHDFATFAGMGAGMPWSEWQDRPRKTVRRIFRCGCREIPDTFTGGATGLIEVVVVGDAFLPRQVRSMVGALIEVGRGRQDPAWIDRLLAQADRRGGPETVAAHGLVLWSIGYAPYGDGPSTADV